MKKLNNAMNGINEKYIEEAANATYIENKKGKLIRNIAVSAAGVAAAAGICIGLGSAGVFGGSNKGVDLLPASSVPSSDSASTTSATTVEKSEIELPGVEIPETMPLVNITNEYAHSLIFGSEFPEMLYADNERAIFTDGVNGLYVYDFESEKLVSALDITATIRLGIPDLPAVPQHMPGWDGIEVNATSDGTLYCSVSYSPVVSTGSGRPFQQELRTQHYIIDCDKQVMKHTVEKPERNSGLFNLPNDGSYKNISLYAASIEETDEYVFIRNCTADIDLLPRFDLQYIELRRAAEGDNIEECMEGGYFPFDDINFPSTLIGADYEGGNDNGDLYGLHIDKNGFLFEAKCKCPLEPLHGSVEVFGDIVQLTEQESGYIWLYRMSGNELVPIITDQNDGLTDTAEMDKLGSITLKKLDNTEELCNSIKAANEPAQILTEYSSYHIGVQILPGCAVGDMFVDSSNVASAKNMFLSADEICKSIENDGEMLIIKTEIIGVSDSKSACYRQYHVDADSLLLSEIEEFDRDMLTTAIFQFGYTSDMQAEIDEMEDTIAQIQSGISDLQAEIDEIDTVNASAEIIAEIQAGQEKYGVLYDATEYIKLQWPLYDEYRTITTQYGYDEWRGGEHYGIDITGEDIFGADIMAAADGRVIAVNSDRNDAMGCWLAIDHGNGIVSVYAHCESISATEGMEVAAGSVIASVGSTGWSTGNHLHFAVVRDFDFVDPFEYGFV